MDDNVRMGLKLVFKIVLWTVLLVWLLSYLAFGLLAGEAVPKMCLAVDVTSTTAINILQNWFRFTVIVFGIFFAIGSYRVIGKWEFTNGDDEDEADYDL